MHKQRINLVGGKRKYIISKQRSITTINVITVHYKCDYNKGDDFCCQGVCRPKSEAVDRDDQTPKYQVRQIGLYYISFIISSSE